MTDITDSDWIVKLLAALLSLLFASWFRGGHKSHGETEEKDPFEILGLDGGKANTTIEEAIKARRKLALIWHPDRNIGKEEAATLKMQEINYAFTQVEKILAGGGNAEEDVTASESESEDEDFNDKATKERAEQYWRKGRQEEAKFERDVEEEFIKFNRAQKNATRGSFDTKPPPFASAAVPPSKVGIGMGKKARKQEKRMNRDRRRRAQAAAPQCRDIPFHHLPLEKRFEIKFESKELLKSAVFTALRTRAYHVLRELAIEQNLCDPIPLSTEVNDCTFTRPIFAGRVYVTPLMIASYLGDHKAVEIITGSAGSKWRNVLLKKTNQGDDCLTLAKEAQDIAQLLYDEARVYESEATTQMERKRREKIVVKHAEKLEMAVELVRRLDSMKSSVSALTRLSISW